MVGPGNLRARMTDTLWVTDARCQECRESLSAGWDGEDGPLDGAAVTAHLSQCADCRDWGQAAGAVNRALRVRAADPVPDLSLTIGRTAAAMGLASTRAAHPDRRSGPRWWWSTDGWRVALAVLAIAQLLLGVAQLFGIGVIGHGDHAMAGVGSGPADDHLFNESSAWNIAIGAGFAAAAMLPRLAAGLLPMLLVFLGVLTVVSVSDLVRGEVTAGRVATHLLVVAGVLVLWRVHRCYRRSPLPGQRQAGTDAVLYGVEGSMVGDRTTDGGEDDGRRGRWLRPAGRRAA